MKRNQKSKTTDILQLNYINDLIQDGSKRNKIDANDVSDGYHTFGQLYDCRLAYNAALFNEWATENSYQTEARLGHNAMMGDTQAFKPKYNVHKSLRHYDGELCFGGGWFIVVAVLPTGQISNHYKVEDWDLFKIPEKAEALIEFDGHTTDDVITRLLAL